MHNNIFLVLLNVFQPPIIKYYLNKTAPVGLLIWTSFRSLICCRRLRHLCRLCIWFDVANPVIYFDILKHFANRIEMTVLMYMSIHKYFFPLLYLTLEIHFVLTSQIIHVVCHNEGYSRDIIIVFLGNISLLRYVNIISIKKVSYFYI